MRFTSIFRFATIFLTIITLFLTFHASSFAQDTKWYLGAGYGASKNDTGVTSLTGTASLDEDDSGFKIFGGFQFNKFFGVEVGYIDLGEAELKGNTGDTFVSGGTTYQFLVDGVTVTAEGFSIPVFAVFSLPMDTATGVDFFKYFTPFAKIGFHYWENDFTVTSSSLSTETGDDDGTDLAFGLGLNINLTRNFSIRGEWERLNTEEESDFFSGSIIFKF